jgi:sporulation protein YlmC with PRC-barrel domain
MFRLLQGASAMTLAAALAFGPVASLAQSATGTGETAPGTTGVETPIPPAGQTAQETLPPGGDAGPETAEVIEPAEGTIQMQDENTVLASDLMGARIFNSADESVGSIDDIIVSTEGTVEGVVIGVGGFLGIGKKLVAVEMSQISVRTDAAGNPRLLLDSTRDALQAAPAFVTVAEQARLQEIQDVQPTQGTTGGLGTGAAPPAIDQ